MAEKRGYMTGFCGLTGLENHQRCPSVISNGAGKTWACTCDCHKEKNA